METPVSKSQTRAMILAGIALVDSYTAAAQALDAAGLTKDGIPAGQTWRTAAKLSDAELLAGIRAERSEGRITAQNLAEYGY